MDLKVLVCLLVFCLQISAGVQNVSAAPVDDLRQTPVVRAVQRVASAVVNIHTRTIVEEPTNPFGAIPGGEIFGQFLRAGEEPAARTKEPWFRGCYRCL